MVALSRGVARCIGGATPASRLLLIGALCALLGALPLRTLDALPQLCLWERLLGWCPAHGTAHALVALLHGDPARALAYNPNVILVAPLITGLAARDLLFLLRRRGP